MRVLLIDNYDSFTFNLVQLLEGCGAELSVIRNDEADISELEKLMPQFLVISPGPGNPKTAGISEEAILHFHKRIPILGVCLGHQSLASAFGGRIRHAKCLIHGKSWGIYHDGKGLFKNLRQNPFDAARYHSLTIDKSSLPSEFEISAQTNEGEIMGIRHKTLPLEGIQFHPESFLTQYGEQMIQNYLSLA